MKDHISKLEWKLEVLTYNEKKLKKDFDAQNSVAKEALKTVEKLAEKFDQEKIAKKKQLEEQFKQMKAELVEKYELEVCSLKWLNEKLY